MRIWFFVLSALFLSTLLTCSTAFAQKRAVPKHAFVKADAAANAARLRTLFLQKNFAHFPLLELQTTPRDNRRFVTTTLFQHPLRYGERAYDGFRFLAPSDATDFCWVFAKCPVTADAYIVPRQGTMVGFQEYYTLNPASVVSDRQAWYVPIILQKSVLLEGLPSHSLQGGKEYLLCFFQSPQAPPGRFACAISFRPTDGSGEQMSAKLGIFGAFGPPVLPSAALAPIPPTEPVGKEAPRLLSVEELKEIFVGNRTLTFHHDSAGHSDGRVLADVILNNHSRYALSEVTFRLSLYHKTPEGKTALTASLPYTVTIESTLPGDPSPRTSLVPLPPLGNLWVKSGLLDTHLPIDPAKMTGYWMEMTSALGTPTRPALSLPPLERLTLAAEMGDLDTAQEIARAAPSLTRIGRDAVGNSLLDHAVLGDHAAVAAFLLAQGTDVNADQPQATPLLWAARAKLIDGPQTPYGQDIVQMLEKAR